MGNWKSTWVSLKEMDVLDIVPGLDDITSIPFLEVIVCDL